MNMLRYGLLIVSLFTLLNGVSMTQDTDGNSIRISASWEGAAAEGFQTVLDLFTNQTGIEVIYEPVPNLVDTVLKSAYLDNPADIALLSRPGLIRQLVENMRLVPLDSDFDPILEPDTITDTLSREFIRLGTFDGQLYGLTVTSRSKSTFWYKPASFEEFDLDVPQTWHELQTIVDTYVDEGKTPFALGGGDGWTLTDWFENIFIRTHGPDPYRQLFVSQILEWQNSAVRRSFRQMSDMLLPLDERLSDGEDSILNIGYRASVESWLNGDAEMYYEGGFVRTYAEEIYPDLVCGEDYSFFMFPEIDPEYGTPIVGGSELVVVFNDSPAVREFMTFIASPEAATAWVMADVGSIISPNLGVDISVYDDECTAMEAKQIRETDIFAFDGSDLMSGIFGEYAFFVGLQDYLLNPDALTPILEFLEDAANKS